MWSWWSNDPTAPRKGSRSKQKGAYMDETRWERIGAAAGIGFAVLLIVSFFIAGQPPHIDASNAKILNFLGDHRAALLTGSMLNGVAVLMFLWFLGHLRHVLHRAEGGVEALSPIVLASGITAAVFGMMTTLLQTGLVMAAHTTDGAGDAGAIRMLWIVNWVALAAVMLCVGLFAAVTGLAMVRKELVSPAVGYIGLVSTVFMWAGGISGLYMETYNAFWAFMPVIGTMLFALFILVTGVTMLRVPEVAKTESRGAVFAH